MSASKQTAEDRVARLLSASYRGERDLVEAVLTDTDPNVRGNDGTTPLLYATYYGHPDIVDLLLEKGADPNLYTTTDHDTALIYASHFKNNGIAESLLDKGANPNLENRSGHTALDYAMDSSMSELIHSHGGRAGSSVVPNRASRVKSMASSRHRSYRRKPTLKRTRRNRRA